MADWVERVTDWELNVTDEIGSGYQGDGQRVFVEKDGGPDSLPDLGDSMYDPAGTITYPGIAMVSKKYSRTHSACGYGRTVTCSYGSTQAKKYALQKKEEYGVWSGGLKVLTLDASVDWAWFTDDAKVGNAINFAADVADMSGRVAETIQWIMPTGSFTKRIEKTPGVAYTNWISLFIGLVGKVNNAAFESFPIGCVLLNSFDAQRTKNEDGDDIWQIDVQYLWRVVPGKTSDGWQWFPSNVNVIQKLWGRPVLVERSPGAGTVVDGKQLIYLYGAIQGASA